MRNFKLTEKEKTVISSVTIVMTILLYLIALVFITDRKPITKEWIGEEEIKYEEFLDSIINSEKDFYEGKKSFIENKKDSKSKVVVSKNNKVFKVTVTKYNPVKDQCDSDPLITADNSKICLNKLNSGKLKWIAISRDLRKHFKYGEKVIIKCDHDPSINGEYEVHDTMNPRYTKTIDLLSPIGDTKGKWKNVEIRKARD